MTGIANIIGGTVASYRIEHHGNCVLVFGDVPLSKFSALTKLVPKNSVITPHLARLAGANMAMGPKEETEALAESLRTGAIQNAMQQYAGSGLSEAAITWLAVGEQGSSSRAIFARLTGVPPAGMSQLDKSAHPHDPGDVSRCRKLLDEVPELNSRFEEMAKVSQQWARLISSWKDICATMDEESPEWRVGQGRAAKTAAIISKCIRIDNA